jgi:Rps23 Pro-64 3,4-dihydroxylase Tpa1-like proline 4-hydroxylase
MHKWEKAEYILIKNVCSEDELRLCKNELEIVLPALESPEFTSSAKDENNNLKKENMGLFFNKIYNPTFGDFSPCTKIIDKALKIISTKNFTPQSIMNYMKLGGYGYNVLFSAYKDKDYYKAHTDISTLTLLFWIKNKDFSGGNLTFVEFNEQILFEDNCVLIFPSHYLHEVDKVESSCDGYVRYVLTAFVRPEGCVPSPPSLS